MRFSPFGPVFAGTIGGIFRTRGSFAGASACRSWRTVGSSDGGNPQADIKAAPRNTQFAKSTKRATSRFEYPARAKCVDPDPVMTLAVLFEKRMEDTLDSAVGARRHRQLEQRDIVLAEEE